MSIARLTSASASERATALNENFLQRISADIHDGAGQDLSFALMRLKSLAEERPEQPELAENLAPVRIAVEAALTDLRAISADLQLPDIEHLTVQQLAARVVRDYENKTTVKVGLQSSVANLGASARVKIAVYRLLQESLPMRSTTPSAKTAVSCWPQRAATSP